jgi:hypothetical protein
MPTKVARRAARRNSGRRRSTAFTGFDSGVVRPAWVRYLRWAMSMATLTHGWFTPAPIGAVDRACLRPSSAPNALYAFQGA